MAKRSPEEIKEYKRQHYLANKEKYKERVAKWEKENPERKAASARKDYLKRREHILSVNKAYRETLPKEKLREYETKWRKANVEKVRAASNNRRKKVKNATPPWVSLQETRCFYEMAARVSKCLGISHDVDHYYPINGNNSCGLHVPWNLRVIPSSLNRKKSNTIPKDTHNDP